MKAQTSVERVHHVVLICVRPLPVGNAVSVVETGFYQHTMIPFSFRLLIPYTKKNVQLPTPTDHPPCRVIECSPRRGKVPAPHLRGINPLTAWPPNHPFHPGRGPLLHRLRQLLLHPRKRYYLILPNPFRTCMRLLPLIAGLKESLLLSRHKLPFLRISSLK